MADKTYKLEFNLSDGSKVHAGNITVPQGPRGLQGEPGQTGKSAYQSYVDSGGTLTEAQWAAGAARGAPEFADSVAEMVDTDKVYVLTTDGCIYKYGTAAIMVESTNLVPASKDTGGNTFNGTGYKVGYRLSSSGAEKTLSGGVVTGYIPYSGEVIRVRPMARSSNCYISLYNASYTLLNTDGRFSAPYWYTNGGASLQDGEFTIDPASILETTDYPYRTWLSQAKYIRVSSDQCGGEGTALVVTLNQPTAGGVVTTQGWQNTGLTYTPADYEDRVVTLERNAVLHEQRLLSLETADTASAAIPVYWQDHLAEKADKIQRAMEAAGRNKSAFLWYTDAHWVNGSSKMSPRLLNYLIRHTPMNKVNFGGDIIGDSLLATRDEMAYLYEWRSAIKDLPNHHSVIGNHDDFRSDTVAYEDSGFAYSFLIAPEESSDMVAGGEFYYYIDNPSERTRYLYLDSGKYSLTDEECQFIIAALTSTPAGWHIVAISHIWFQYTAAASPTVGSMNAYMQKVLNLFDAYNARGSGNVTMKNTAHGYNFTGCSGKVEFCIGGHIHYQHQLASAGGIPVILTPPDANQVRGGNTYAPGTITEASVCGVVADYTNRKIRCIYIGRGSDTEIAL